MYLYLFHHHHHPVMPSSSTLREGMLFTYLSSTFEIPSRKNTLNGAKIYSRENIQIIGGPPGIATWEAISIWYDWQHRTDTYVVGHSNKELQRRRRVSWHEIFTWSKRESELKNAFKVANLLCETAHLHGYELFTAHPAEIRMCHFWRITLVSTGGFRRYSVISPNFWNASVKSNHGDILC